VARLGSASAFSPFASGYFDSLAFLFVIGVFNAPSLGSSPPSYADILASFQSGGKMQTE
jgi:hypothetical protein